MQSQWVFQLCNNGFVTTLSGDMTWTLAITKLGVKSEQREISGPGEPRGYRAVWHSLRLNHHIHVPRERVVDILCELNPAVTRKRRPRRLAMRRYTSYGSNFCWHVVTADFYLQVESVNTKQHCSHISINKQSSKIIIGPNKFSLLVSAGRSVKKNSQVLISWFSALFYLHFQ